MYSFNNGLIKLTDKDISKINDEKEYLYLECDLFNNFLENIAVINFNHPSCLKIIISEKYNGILEAL